jgi:hypothetical protein
MNLVPKEILMSHLKRSEGAEEVSLPIDFFRDLLYQAMPRTWVGLTRDEQSFVYSSLHNATSREDSFWVDFANAIEKALKDKNT